MATNYLKNLHSASYLVPEKAAKKAQASVLEKLNSDSDKNRENRTLLEICQMHWNNMSDYRDRRARARNYERGKQWYELTEDANGDTLTEEELILSQGRLPLKQNMIRQLVRNLMGQYRSNPVKSVVMSRTREDQKLSEMMSNAMQAAKDLNQVTELDAQLFHEHILSGFPIQKVGFKHWKTLNRSDLLLQNINPSRLFYNTDMADLRGFDMNLIGEIVDTDIEYLISQFAKTQADEEWLKNEYAIRRQFNLSQPEGMSADYVDGMDFYTAPEGKCRIFEIWYLQGEWRLYAHDYATGEYRFYPLEQEELLRIENDNRILQAAQYGILPEEVPQIEMEKKYEQVWYVKILTPSGKCLYEGETPYEHEEHPYTISLYPFIDGEVWGLVEDIIDQQRQINRLFSMLDYIMGTDAKNTLVVAEEAIGDMNIEEYAENYVKVGGIITYRSKSGVPPPSILSSNSRSITASEILGLQMHLINQLTGLNPAIQGQSAPSGKAASLYALESQNSAINIRDIMDSFSSFMKNRDMKILKVIKQFYNERIYLATSGKSYAEEAKVYDPMAVKDMEFTSSIAQGMDTPVYRQMVDETLMNLFQAQAIDVMTLLENSSLPQADKIIEGIKRRQTELQEQAGQSGMMPPEAMQEAGMQTGGPQPQNRFSPPQE